MLIPGWSPRVNDAIYAGCIPVLTAEGTHYPYSTTLDWTKFSVRLLPTDLDRIEEILAQSDVVSLHCPLTPETTNLIDTAALAAMKKTAVLVNCARGGVVNEAELVVALRNRVIAGAAMDVYSIEPLPADSELLTLDNIVVTPHLAAMAADNFAPTVSRMFANIAHVSRGEPVPEKDLVV